MKILLRRAGALAAAVMMCFALTVPALADELVDSEVTVYNRWDVNGNFFGKSTHYSNPNGSSSYSGNQNQWRQSGVFKAAPSFFTPVSLSTADGYYGLYASGYMYSTSAIQQNHAPISSDWHLRYVSSATGKAEILDTSVSAWDPDLGSSYTGSDGYTVKAHWTNSVAEHATSVALYNGSYNSTPAWYVETVSGSYATDYVYSYLTNVSYVSFESQSAADAIEGIADSIADQNQILSAYYGDIVAICNEIYQRLGDMQQTQEEANALLSSLISLLNTTNSKISSLNQAMSTYFELVLKSLANESLSIRDCIDDAEARLELYLKPMIDYFIELEEQTGESAATLPQHKTDIDGFDNQGYGIDGDGQAGLAALVPIFGSFSWIFSVIAIFIGVGIINLLVKKGMS